MPADNAPTVMTAASEAAAFDAVATMYDAHVDVVFTYLARRVGGQLAHDLTADVFRLAIEQFSTYDASLGSPRSWLLGIATNLVRRHWRTEHRRLRAFARAARREPSSVDPLTAIDDQLDASRRLEQIIEAVDRLAPDDRDLLVLVAWRGCSQAEVAEVLAIPPGTVGSRLSRIRAVLRTTTSTPGSSNESDPR